MNDALGEQSVELRHARCHAQQPLDSHRPGQRWELSTITQNGTQRSIGKLENKSGSVSRDFDHAINFHKVFVIELNSQCQLLLDFCSHGLWKILPAPENFVRYLLGHVLSWKTICSAPYIGKTATSQIAIEVDRMATYFQSDPVYGLFSLLVILLSSPFLLDFTFRKYEIRRHLSVLMYLYVCICVCVCTWKCVPCVCIICVCM